MCHLCVYALACMQGISSIIRSIYIVCIVVTSLPAVEGDPFFWACDGMGPYSSFKSHTTSHIKDVILISYPFKCV